MFELVQRLMASQPSNMPKLSEDIAKLASKEREVRTLETLIEYISSVEEEELEVFWPRLIAAIHSTRPPNDKPLSEQRER